MRIVGGQERAIGDYVDGKCDVQQPWALVLRCGGEPTNQIT